MRLIVVQRRGGKQWLRSWPSQARPFPKRLAAPTPTLYCYVPKAGCTFWKRVHIALSRNLTLNSSSVFSLTRNEVHDLVAGGVRYNDVMHSPEHFPIRFFVVREPFSRLISTYLDKVWLPDLWHSDVEEFLKKLRLRGPHLSKRALKSIKPDKDFLRTELEWVHRKFGNESEHTSRLGSTLEDQRCGKYASFRELVLADFTR